MQVATITVDHLIGLDGTDQGPSVIEVGPSGDISVVRPRSDPEGTDDAQLTAIPLLADAHAHLGISDGVREDETFHTLECVDSQLLHLAARGVGHLHSLGTDQRWLQQRLRLRLSSGDAGGKAFGYSAGVGFGAVNGWPPELTAPEPRFRPKEPEAARQQVRELAGLGCRTLKIWIDDLGGMAPKVPLDVVGAILDEARHCHIVTFAHVHDHADAEELVSRGIAVLAHSVRDRVMTPGLIEQMREKGVALVPTLFREEAEVFFSLDENPYMTDPFFLSSERDLVSRLKERRFSKDPDTPRRRLEIALVNVARVHAAGVPIGLGTDSGFKMKPQGFAQHRELQLLRQAGIGAADCFKAALETNKRLFASAVTPIAAGAAASFFVVQGNPMEDIRATTRIKDVWVCGRNLSQQDLTL